MLSLRSLRHRGFTVLEVLVALLVIGVLTSVAVVKFADAKQKLYIDAQMNDLRNYALAQELYYDAQGGYGLAADVVARQQHHWSADVAVDSQDVATPTQRWFLRTQHAKTDVKCWLAINHLEDPNAQRIRCGDGIEAPVGVLVADFWAHATDGVADRPIPMPDTFTVSHSATVQFNGSASIPGANAIVQWRWTFGDGQSASGQVVTHDYSAVDTFAVTLTVIDAAGATATVTKPVVMQNLAPVAVLEVADAEGAVVTGDAGSDRADAVGRVRPVTAALRESATPTVNAQQGAGTRLTPGTYILDGSQSYDPDGQIASHDFFFSDWRSASGPAIVAEIASNDSVDVILTVTDDLGASSSTVLPIRSGVDTVTLVADFDWTPKPAKTGQSVAFDASLTTVSQPRDLVYIWDFGDWTTGNGVAPGKVFRQPGSFPVQLTVLTLSGKTDTVTKTVVVEEDLGVPTDALRYFWDFCASYGKSALVNKGSVGAAGNASISGMQWNAAPIGPNGEAYPTALSNMEWVGGSAGISSFSGNVTSHTFAVSYSMRKFNPGTVNFLHDPWNGLSEAEARFTARRIALTPVGPDTTLGRPERYHDGRQHTAVFVLNAADSIARVYVDGALVAQGSYTPAQMTGAHTLFGAGAASYQERHIYGAAYYARALPAEEVGQLATTLQGRRCGSAVPDSLHVRPDSVTMAPGDTQQFLAYGFGATPADSMGVVTAGWQSLDPTIATVDQTGRVTALAVGRARILASTETASDVAIAIVAPSAAPAGATGRWTACQSYGEQVLRDEIGDADGILGASTTAGEATDPTWASVTQMADGLTGPPALVTPLDGTSAKYVKFPTFRTLSVSHTFSFVIASPVKPLFGTGYLLTHGSRVNTLAVSTSSYFYSLAAEMDGQGWVAYTAEPGQSVLGATVTDGRIHTVTYTFDADRDSSFVYVDGVLVGRRRYNALEQNAFAASRGTVHLGSEGNYPFAGYFYGMTYYPRALTTSEVGQLDGATRVPTCAEVSNATGVTLDVTPDTLQLQTGDTARAYARVTRDGKPVGVPVTWIARDPLVATADSAGKLTAVAPGQTWVVATAETARDSAFVEVTESALPPGALGKWAACGAWQQQVVPDLGSGGFDGYVGSTASTDANDIGFSNVAPLGGAFKASAATQYVTLPTFQSLSTRHTFVLSFMAPTSFRAWSNNEFFSHPNVNLWHDWSGAFAASNGGGGTFAVVPGQASNAALTATYPYNQMHTAAYVFERDSAWLWIDGVLRGRRAITSFTLPASPMTRIGGEYGTTWASIGTLAYYPRALQQSEIERAHADLMTARCQAPGRGALNVQVTPDPIRVAPNATVLATAAVTDEAGNQMFNATVTWQSLNSTIAAVGQDGTVYGRSLGTTSIVAVALTTDGGMASDTVPVTVALPTPVTLELTPNPLIVANTAYWANIGTVLRDADGKVIGAPNPRGFTWEVTSGSTAFSIASTTLHSTVVYPKAVGTGTVRVTYGDLSATADVQIVFDSSAHTARQVTLWQYQSHRLQGWMESGMETGWKILDAPADPVVRLSPPYTTYSYRPGLAVASTMWIEARKPGTATVVGLTERRSDTSYVTVLPRGTSRACLAATPAQVEIGVPVVLDPSCSQSANGGFAQQKITVAAVEGTAASVGWSFAHPDLYPFWASNAPITAFGPRTVKFREAGTYYLHLELYEPCDTSDWTMPDDCSWALPYVAGGDRSALVKVEVTGSPKGTLPTAKITKVTMSPTTPHKTYRFDGFVADADRNLEYVKWFVETIEGNLSIYQGNPMRRRIDYPVEDTVRTFWEEKLPPGTYKVSLHARDLHGYMTTDTTRVVVPSPTGTNRPPVAVFTGPTTAGVGQPVTFDGWNSYDPDGDLLTWSWSFEGATPSWSRTPMPTNILWTAPGTYRVLLTVSDGLGGQHSISKYIAVGTASTGGTVGSDVAAKAAFAFNPNNAPSGTTVTFDASASQPSTGATLTNFAWSFSDGTVATGIRPSRTFSASGNYTATLTITDSKGKTHSTAKTVSVSVAIARIEVLATHTTLHNCGNTSAKPQVTFTAKAYDAGNNLVDVPIMWTYSNTAQGTQLSPNYTTRNTWTTTVSYTQGSGTMTVRAAPSPNGPMFTPFNFSAGYAGVEGTKQVSVAGCVPGA